MFVNKHFNRNLFVREEEEVKESEVNRGEKVGKLREISYNQVRKMVDSSYCFWSNGKGTYVFAKEEPSVFFNRVNSIPAGAVFKYDRITNRIYFFLYGNLLSVIEAKKGD